MIEKMKGVIERMLKRILMGVAKFLIFVICMNILFYIVLDPSFVMGLVGEKSSYKEDEISQYNENLAAAAKVVSKQNELKKKLEAFILKKLWGDKFDKNFRIKENETVSVSGLCLIKEGLVKRLLDEQVLVTESKDGAFKGVVRHSGETVSCERKGIKSRPVDLANIIPVNKVSSHPLSALKNKSILITGVCSFLNGEKDVFVSNHISDATDVLYDEEDHSFYLKAMSHSSSDVMKCQEGNFKYTALDEQSAKDLKDGDKSKERKVKYYVVTGQCSYLANSDLGKVIEHRITLLDTKVKVLSTVKENDNYSKIKVMPLIGELKAKVLSCNATNEIPLDVQPFVSDTQKKE